MTNKDTYELNEKNLKKTVGGETNDFGLNGNNNDEPNPITLPSNPTLILTCPQCTYTIEMSQDEHMNAVKKSEQYLCPSCNQSYDIFDWKIAGLKN